MQAERENWVREGTGRRIGDSGTGAGRETERGERARGSKELMEICTWKGVERWWVSGISGFARKLG